MKKKKLSLEKKTIISLSEHEKIQIMGGGEQITTSFTDCTHFICCGETCGLTTTLDDTCNLPRSYNPAECWTEIGYTGC